MVIRYGRLFLLGAVILSAGTFETFSRGAESSALANGTRLVPATNGRLNLRVSADSDGAAITVRLAPGRESKRCRVVLAGRIEGGEQRAWLELRRFVNPAAPIVLVARGLPALGSNSNLALALRAESRCRGVANRSRIVRVRPVQNQQSALSAEQWLQQFARALVADGVTLVESFPEFQFVQPVDLQGAADGQKRIFVVEQRGIIWSVRGRGAAARRNVFLDISDRVSVGGERGLLGLAFDPLFRENGRFFVHYSRAGNGATVIARYTRDEGNANRANKDSELKILEVQQPFSNHNGGQIGFGPDGYLYIALGDGGGAGDPQGNGQNLATLLGKILRINVADASPSNRYRVPSSNPFVGVSGARGEIWAYGLRNPWRFCFDPITNELWAGDVGQNAFEEVNRIRRGENYGWNTLEGDVCFSPRNGCDGADKTSPVLTYGRDAGRSITGGCVYRGSAAPGLQGRYIYGDFLSGKVWGIPASVANPKPETIFSTEHRISSFGRDDDGELYLLSYGDGRVFKFSSVS